jgi:polar amino acid transport system substrate-binding protein
MLKPLSIAILSVALGALGFAPAASAETVMEKVARTGVLTLGAGTELIPYAYFDNQSELVGYSIDIANLIKADIEAYLDEEITLEIVPVTTFGDRMAKLQTSEIDFTCDTVFTWNRDQVADSSDSYGVMGIRLLVPAGSSLDGTSSLSGTTIGVMPSPLLAAVAQVFYPDATLVDVAGFEAGLDALDQGTVEALVGDSVLLAGYTQPRDPANYKLIPEQALTHFGIACMVPEQNSSFLDLINYSITKFREGYVTEQPDAIAIVDRWFGDNGVVPLGSERLDLVRELFRFQLLQRAQIPPGGLDFRGLE